MHSAMCRDALSHNKRALRDFLLSDPFALDAYSQAKHRAHSICYLAAHVPW